MDIEDLFVPVARGEIHKVQHLCVQNPHWSKHYKAHAVVYEAAQKGNVDILRILIQRGFPVQAAVTNDPGKPRTALVIAIDFDRDGAVELLLASGADANGPHPGTDRPLVAAVNYEKTPERRLKYVKLLVEHGAEVNRLYTPGGDPDKLFTVLDWTEDAAVVAYLRSQGAKTAAELRGAAPARPARRAASPADEVVAYFQKQFGDVDDRALIELVPGDPPVTIHVIRPAGNRKHLTLFTTGLSSRPMRVPPGQDDYAWAELFIQLPGNWDFLCDEVRWSWPLTWMRKMAHYPHDAGTWLGGPLTILANDDPPQPLAPGLPFTSWLLLAEKSFRRGDGQTVQLYRLTPLYTDERELELREGAPALMRAFDRRSVPFVVDLHRPSVAR